MPTVKKTVTSDALNPKKVAARRMAGAEDSGFDDETAAPAPAPRRDLSKPGPVVDPRKNTKGLTDLLKKRGG